MGSVRAERPSSYMLAAIAVMVRTLGIGFVKPSVYFRPTAQQASSSPAITRSPQAISTLLLSRRLVLTGYVAHRPGRNGSEKSIRRLGHAGRRVNEHAYDAGFG